MKIAHFETSMNWGGQELRIIEQMEWLLNNDHQAWLIARPGSEILREAKKRGLPHFPLTVKGSLHPQTLLKLLRFIKEHQVDVLDCHGNRDATYGLFVKLMTSVKVIRSRHVTTPIKRGFLRDAVWHYGCHRIITTAKAINEIIIANGLAPAEKIYAAIPGVDHKRFNPDICGKELREKYSIPQNAFVIANVGMIRPDKGQLFFVEAANKLISQGVNIVAIHLGDATAETQGYKEQVLSAIKSSVKPSLIKLLGYHHDIENYIAMADAVAVCSIKVEAQTRLVTQAFLMKKNVVATNVGGLPEMIENNYTGLLCKPENADELVAKIKQLIDDSELSSTLKENGYYHAMDKLTFERMMHEMMAVYSH